MADVLPRFRRREQAVADAAKLDKLLEESELRESGTAGGDARRLRGIPAVARAVQGAIPGTTPGQRLK
jgi:hypothetical protein